MIPSNDHTAPNRATEVDPEFPLAKNSYSCAPCKRGDHADCALEDVGMSHRYPCTCYQTSLQAHIDAKNAVLRETLATLIYAEAGDWYTTVDGTPNAASYAIADALIAKRLLRAQR